LIHGKDFLAGIRLNVSGNMSQRRGNMSQREATNTPIAGLYRPLEKKKRRNKKKRKKKKNAREICPSVTWNLSQRHGEFVRALRGIRHNVTVNTSQRHISNAPMAHVCSPLEKKKKEKKKKKTDFEGEKQKQKTKPLRRITYS